MTTPTKERLRLDRFLRDYGTGTGTLTRIVGSTHQASYSVSVRYHMRDYAPLELDENIIQGDSHVIISSTEIIKEQWPGAQTMPVSPPTVPRIDPRVPRRNDTFTTQEGRRTNVENTNGGTYFQGELIRIEMQVRGQ